MCAYYNSALLKVQKQSDFDYLKHRLEQIRHFVYNILDRSEDEEGDFEIAGKFLLKFHEFSKHPDDHCFLVGELEDVVYPLVCAFFHKLFVTNGQVYVDTNELCYGNTRVTLDEISTYIQDKISIDFDWFTAIDAIEFPLPPTQAQEVHVDSYKEF